MADLSKIKVNNTDYNIKDKIARDLGNFIGYNEADIYGVEVNFNTRTFTRLANAVGKTGGSDFNSVKCFNRRRCNLTDDGTVTAYYGDEAYTETGALTQALTINGKTLPIGTQVQVMVEQPKFYYKVVPISVEEYTTQNGDVGYAARIIRYYVSPNPKEGFKVHPAFVRNGHECDRIYLSAYEGCIYDVSENAYILNDAQIADFNSDKFSSIANAKPASGLSQNLTRANTRKLAQNRGTGWEQAYIHTLSASQLLMLIEYASFDMQSKIGNGVTSKAAGEGNESELTGATVNLGNASGESENASGQKPVSYRGEENLWGDIWTWIDGFNEKNPATFDAGNYGTLYIADHGFADNIGASPYRDTRIYPIYSGGNYINAFGYSEDFDFLFVPCEIGGASNPPVGDYFYNNVANWRIGKVGGAWADRDAAGAFYLRLDSDASERYRSLGGRLVYVPIEDIYIDSDKEVFKVNFTSSGTSTCTADQTIEAIQAAYLAGKVIIGENSGDIYYAMYSNYPDTNTITFQNEMPMQDFTTIHVLDYDNTDNIWRYWSYERPNGYETFVITYTVNNTTTSQTSGITKDKTNSEIQAAYDAGKTIIAKVVGGSLLGETKTIYLNLNEFDTDEYNGFALSFSSIDSTTNIKYSITDGGSLYSSSLSYWVKKLNDIYAVCVTDSATAAKIVVTGNDYVPTIAAGQHLTVKFDLANTASTPTITLQNSTGVTILSAKAITSYNAIAEGADYWRGGEIVEFVYDGNYWVDLDSGIATTTYYGKTKLSSSLSSIAQNVAATPYAVKQAYDKASAALQLTADTTYEAPEGGL